MGTCSQNCPMQRNPAAAGLDRKFGALYEYSLSGSTAINRGAQGESTTIYLFGWDYTSSVDGCTLTTTVADKFMGKVVGEPYRGKLDVRLCVQVRLVCSAGVRPARVTVRSPVAWMAGMRETDYLKPIDKAILRGCERVTGP